MKFFRILVTFLMDPYRLNNLSALESEGKKGPKNDQKMTHLRLESIDLAVFFR